MRTTNNFIFSSLDAWRTTLQQARDTTKQIFHLNSNAAKTFEQNAKELTRATQDAVSQNNNTSYNSRGGSNTNTSSNTNTTPGTTTSSL